LFKKTFKVCDYKLKIPFALSVPFFIRYGMAELYKPVGGSCFLRRSVGWSVGGV